MKMHIGGKWMDSDDRIDVVNPFDGTTIDTVPKATPQDVSDAIAAIIPTRYDPSCSAKATWRRFGTSSQLTSITTNLVSG